MKIWMATLLAAGVLLTGCGDDSLDLLDPNDYPLNPATPREGAQGTADWAAVLVDAAEKTAALVADQDVDVTEGCVEVDGAAAQGATLTFDQCPSEQGEVSGTVTLAPVVNQTGTATFDLTVDEEPASGSNEPYEITGSTSFALTGASDGVHQTGTARVEQGLSRINLQTDLTYPVGPTSSDQRIPEGTVQANYQTLGLTLLRVTLEFDGDNTVAVDVNGQDFSYDITTGQLT